MFDRKKYMEAYYQEHKDRFRQADKKWRTNSKTARRSSRERLNQKGNRAYVTWTAMKYRCFNARCKDFEYYGGRGISVCERWKGSFSNFLADMGPRPTRGHSIDRTDVNGNYEPSNCRWATHKQQQRNKQFQIRRCGR